MIMSFGFKKFKKFEPYNTHKQSDAMQLSANEKI